MTTLKKIGFEWDSLIPVAFTAMLIVLFAATTL